MHNFYPIYVSLWILDSQHLLKSGATKISPVRAGRVVVIQELRQEARVVVDGDELGVPLRQHVHLPLVLLDHALDDLVGLEQVVGVLALE